jgi:hypothetical protein
MKKEDITRIMFQFEPVRLGYISPRRQDRLDLQVRSHVLRSGRP